MPLILVPFAVLLNSKANISFVSDATYLNWMQLTGVQFLHKYFGSNRDSSSADNAFFTNHQMEKFYGESFGFIVWWLCVSNVIMTVCGLIYYKIRKENPPREKIS